MTDIMTLHSPRAWKLFRLGQLFREVKEKGSDKEFPPLSVTMRGIVPQLETAAKSDDGDNRKVVRVGNYVINSRSDRKGSGGISEFDGSVSLISIVLEPRNVHRRYVHHLLRSPAFQEEFYRWGHGIVADLWTTRYSDMKNIRLRIPDLHTQRAIADFLDRETARIDLLIEKKQRLVELLGEKRSAVITSAVTGDAQGRDRLAVEGGGGVKQIFLNSNNDVRRRKIIGRSNVGPIGVSLAEKAPKEWCVTTLQRLFTVSSGDFLSPDQLKDDGFPVFGGNGLRGFFSDTNCPENTMLIGRYGALCGNVHLPNERVWATEHAFRVRPLMKYHQSYIARYVETLEMRHLAARAAQPGLNSRMVREQAIALPDLPTQRAIADFLDRETARIDHIRDKTRVSIDRLREYRSSLITAVVTGQIDVTKWVKAGTAERRLDAVQATVST